MRYEDLKKKATPGPWKVIDDRTYGTYGTSILSNGNKVLLSNNWLEDMRMATHCTNKFSDALELINRLIQEGDWNQNELNFWKERLAELEEVEGV